MSDEREHLGAEGVLLYYHFTPLSTGQSEEQQWYLESCSKLNLVGRVRVARDGVNATLGGDYNKLQEHASQIAERYKTTSIDFKLTRSAGRKNEQCATESKFTQLTVDIVKEVVTIGLDHLIDGDGDVTAAPVTARHASPIEFHKLLQRASNSTQSDGDQRETVLVDCRNVYETRIGTFEAAGVTTFDPRTRAFSDLPAWFESNVHKLAGKRVLMCCTGGVRCERASAYLRTLGNCFLGDEDVVQLQGGIERYLEQYGGSGYFKGKNFVFDERGDVEGSVLVEEENGEAEGETQSSPDIDDGGGGGDSNNSSGAVRGTCCICCTPWGDYGARARCSACRMLVLLCESCSDKNNKGEEDGKEDDDGGGETSLKMLCELCQQRSNDLNSSTGKNKNTPPTRVRILCLHGFRQTAKNFQGRTSALRRKLKHVAELVFIDAPHTLPDIYAMSSTQNQQKNPGSKEEEKLKDKNGESNLAERPPTEDINESPATSSPLPSPSSSRGWEQKRLRRGWLLTPEQYTNPHSIPHNLDELDHEQYHRQTAGLEESMKIIDTVLDTQGPWDGILGFSQGASIAALLAARESSGQRSKKERRFKFVICCSGYPSPLLVKGKEDLTISMPSLHVYGTGRQDRQISEPESKSLWELFDPTQRVLLRHNAGHVIPSTRLAASRIAEFIAWAREEEEGGGEK